MNLLGLSSELDSSLRFGPLEVVSMRPEMPSRGGIGTGSWSVITVSSIGKDASRDNLSSGNR